MKVVNKEKVIKYLQVAKEILSKEFPHDYTYGQYISGSIEIAKMLQQEELDRTVITKD